LNFVYSLSQYHHHQKTIRNLEKYPSSSIRLEAKKKENIKPAINSTIQEPKGIQQSEHLVKSRTNKSKYRINYFFQMGNEMLNAEIFAVTI